MNILAKDENGTLFVWTVLGWAEIGSSMDEKRIYVSSFHAAEEARKFEGIFPNVWAGKIAA